MYNKNYTSLLKVKIRYLEPVYENLHDFRYEGGAPINSGFQIPLVNKKRKYGPSYQARTS